MTRRDYVRIAAALAKCRINCPEGNYDLVGGAWRRARCACWCHPFGDNQASPFTRRARAGVLPSKEYK
jgi:hypothetical protein